MKFHRCQHVVRPALIVVLLLLAGCAPLQHLPGAVAPTPTLPTLMIGLVGAAPGPNAFEAGFTGNAAQLAVGAVNDAGGIFWQGQQYQVVLATPGESDIIQEVRDLVFGTPTPLAIIGPDESDAALAAAPIVQSAHIPEISIATTAALTDPALNQKDSQIFRARASDVVSARAISMYAAQHFAGHSIAIATSDNDYGHSGAQIITGVLTGLSMPLAGQVVLEPGALDFAQQAAQVVHSDTIICWSTEIEAATFLHDLRAVGWHGHFIVGVADADFIALAGADGNGVIGATTWSPLLGTPASQQFIRTYMQRFGSQPDEHAAAAYDAVQMLLAAIRAVGPDQTAITRYLATLTGYTGVQGTFDADSADKATSASGDLTTALEIVQVQHGQQVLLTTSG